MERHSEGKGKGQTPPPFGGQRAVRLLLACFSFPRRTQCRERMGSAAQAGVLKGTGHTPTHMGGGTELQVRVLRPILRSTPARGKAGSVLHYTRETWGSLGSRT